jgi:excinuclease ABC subunit B
VRKDISDILQSVYERDHVTIETGDGETKHLVGKDLADYKADLETRMREHASNLEFEEAARIRDELKRLEERDLGLSSADRLKARIERAGAIVKAGRSGRDTPRGRRSGR